MYFTSKSERQLYGNIPRYQMNTISACPSSFNRQMLIDEGAIKCSDRQYKLFINKNETNKNNDLITTELDNDTRNRLYENHNSFDELPRAMMDVERYTQSIRPTNIFGTTNHRNGGDFIENTRERYSSAGMLTDTMKDMLDGDARTNMFTSGIQQQPDIETYTGRKKRVVKSVSNTRNSKQIPFNESVVEKYTYDSKTTESDTDNMFMNMLKSRAKMILEHVLTNPFYRKWIENWKLLSYNLNRTKYLFNRLDQTDADIAYVINKGDEVSFRIRDEIRYVPINIYQYVLYHEMAHMSTTELQHTPKFHELLNILSFAAFELGLIDLRRTTKEYWNTNGQPILCRAALADEIIAGADWLSAANPGHESYFDNIIQTATNMSA